MRRSWVLIAILCLLVSARAQTFDLQTQREPIASLDGLWRFHTGDNPAWASPNFDDSQWPLLRSDEDWNLQGYKNYSGFAWYRFTLKDPTGDKPLSLLLAPILTGYRVYADGKLIGALGYLPPHHLLMVTDFAAYDLPHVGGSRPRDIEIAIQVWHDPVWSSFVPGGPETSGSVAGESSLIHSRLRTLLQAESTSVVDPYAYSILTASFGLLVFGLFVLRRNEHEYLWFAVVVLAPTGWSALYTAYYLSAIPAQIDDCGSGCFAAAYAIGALLFFSIVLRARKNLWWWLSFAAAALSWLGVPLYIFHLTSVAVTNVFEEACLLPSEVWILTVLARRTIERDVDAQLLLIPVLLSFGLDIADRVTLLSYQFGWQRRWFGFDWVVLRKPFDVHLSTVVNTIFLLAMMFFLIRRFSLARREEERLKSELTAAKGVQALLVPAATVETPGFAVDSVYLPASEVGGDFFQLLPGKDGSLLVVVGDVSGKGLRAAMTVSAIVGSLRNQKDRRPTAVLRDLNSVLYGHMSGFATCAAALIGADGAMRLANAGHLAPYRNGEELPADPGLPLGITAEATYSESTFHLNPGDRLTFLSDGVVEATNANRELFGFERTQAISTQTAGEIAEAAKRFGQQDDISVLAITRVPELENVVA